MVPSGREGIVLLLYGVNKEKIIRYVESIDNKKNAIKLLKG